MREKGVFLKIKNTATILKRKAGTKVPLMKISSNRTNILTITSLRILTPSISI